MTFRCPYTEQCRAEALRAFAELPDLAIIFQQRLQCAERDPSRATRCATRLGLTELEMPSLGSYIQERRRAQQMPQRQLAGEVGIEVNELRDIELGKTDPSKLPRQMIDRIAAMLSASSDYLAALARIPVQASNTRQGYAFTRITPATEERSEPDL